MIAGAVVALAVIALLGAIVQEVRSAPSMARPGGLTVLVEPDHSDSLTRLRTEWLADDRPAFETVDAFERDVERVLRGDRTRQPVSRMPLRGRTYSVRSADGDTVTVMAGMGGCAHRSWTDTRCDDCGTTVPF